MGYWAVRLNSRTHRQRSPATIASNTERTDGSNAVLCHSTAYGSEPQAPLTRSSGTSPATCLKSGESYRVRWVRSDTPHTSFVPIEQQLRLRVVIFSRDADQITLQEQPQLCHGLEHRTVRQRRAHVVRPDDPFEPAAVRRNIECLCSVPTLRVRQAQKLRPCAASAGLSCADLLIAVETWSAAASEWRPRAY